MPPAASDTPSPTPSPTVTVTDPSVTATVTTASPLAAPAGTTAPRPAATTPTAHTPTPAPVFHPDLSDPRWKEYAQELVSSAENSTLDWRSQYRYIEDIGDGRGYTAGIIGFCSGTGDLAHVLRLYRDAAPDNALVKYLPALAKVEGTASHQGLDPDFVADWRRAAQDPKLQHAQDAERDRFYFDPAVGQAKADGLHALGQFAYYDAMVMHGPGTDPDSFGGIRTAALRKAKPPSQGGDESAYIAAFLDARKAAMLRDPARHDTSRIDTAQRVFLQAGNLDLLPPLRWHVYGDAYTIPA
ncbi:chitosanase [Kitasatospora sp. NPDC002522]